MVQRSGLPGLLLHRPNFGFKVFDFALDAFPIIVAAGDIDGDGKPDLAVINQNSNTVSVLKNTSTMTLTRWKK